MELARGTFCLPEISFPLSVDTIGRMLALGHGLRMACNTFRCGYSRELNLVRLARRHGMDYPCLHADLVRVVWCPRCRAAGRPAGDIGFTHLALTAPHSDWPRRLTPADPFKRSTGAI